MFAIRLRVSPWSARCSPRSVGRSTRISPFSCLTPMSRFLRSESSPFGPFTLTSSGSMEISTPSGTATGCFPMRLIAQSPHPRHELAAHAGAAGLVAGHDATRGRHNHGAHSALDLGDRAGLHVLAAARLRHPLYALDHGLAVLGVLQAHAQHAAHAGRLNGVALDVALLAQDARDLRLEVRGGHLDVVAVGVQAVADARQEVCDRVGHRHWATSSTSSCRGSCPRAESRARRCGRARTCAGTRAGGRTACSGCSSWSGTWTRAAGGPAGKSLPLLLCLLGLLGSVLALFFVLGGRGRLVRLGVLFLQFLVCGRFCLGLLARLLEAALLLGLVLLDLGCGAGRALRRERHPQLSQENVRLLVRLRGRRDGHVETANLVDGVVVDLGEDDLLAHAHGVVATAVERASVEAPEVADTRDRDRSEAVEELPHARAAQGHAHAHGHAVAELERRDRLARAADARGLARDRGELLRRGVEHVRVLLRVAHAHVERDLLDARDLHHGLVAELLLEARLDLGLVALLEPRRDARRCRGFHQSISFPDFLATRVGWPESGSISITLETWIGPSISTMPPISWARWVSRSVRGFMWRLMMLAPSTKTFCFSGSTRSTRPVLPRSLPAMMRTVSSRRILRPMLRAPPGRARRSS